METKEAEKFGCQIPISDTLADDPGFMDILSEYATYQWTDAVARLGGTPVGDAPTVRTEANMFYGSVIYGPDDEPLLDDDGEPIVDHTKMILTVHGWATRD
jgi:hypothetical protein